MKRGVHEVEIGTDAVTLAAALRDFLREETSFGPIDIKRDPGRAGRDFAVGERFHGCVRIDRSRFRVVFEWQERSGLGRTTSPTWIQACRAAARAGARILGTTIAYRDDSL